MPQHYLSRLVGMLCNCELSCLKNTLIRIFIHVFKIELSSAKEPKLQAYKNFNAFFIRALAKAFTPSSDTRALCSPAEGLLSEHGLIQAGRLIQAKGHDYALNALLAGDQALSTCFYQGQFATIYLAPFNYHRVHMPIAGVLTQLIYVPGRLFSVNLTTTHQVPELFAKNERLIMIFNTEQGKLAVIMVGAMLVAGISNHFVPFSLDEKKQLQRRDVSNQHIKVQQGAELGYFEFGSTVILLLENKNFHFSASANTALDLGTLIGKFNDLATDPTKA